MATASRSELRAGLREVIIEITLLEGQIETPAETRKRTFRIVRGTLINVAGFALASPTGGWSILLCAAGFWEWADALGEDAQVMNRQIAIRQRVAALKLKLRRIEEELGRLG